MKSTENALQSPPPSNHQAERPHDLPAPRAALDARNLLARMLETPQLAQVVSQMQPELLHRVIQHCGLEDCSEMVALATPEQLAQVFDLDLWRSAQPGQDEQFDAERFGVWLEVLLESGAPAAARKLAEIDAELVIAGLSQHALVYDRVAATPYQTLDGEWIEPSRADDDGLTAEVGGYLLVAKRTDAWEAIVEVLMALGEGHASYFNQVMRGCIALSNAGFEDDGLANLLQAGEQVTLNLSDEREGRREKQGYVTPAQARAFLQMARELRLTDHPEPTANPLAQAYFRAVNEKVTAAPNNQFNPTGLLAAGAEARSAADSSTEPAVTAVYEILLDAGIIPQPRALLTGAAEPAPKLAQIRTRLEFVLEQDYSVYLVRNEELAYLANVLLAGCSLQTRPFTAQEASDAAVALCNLGLENWPPQWLPANATTLPGSFLIQHDLISVFQVGWKVLYEKVGMYTAQQLIEVLKGIRCDDREIQWGLDMLRHVLAKQWRAGTPWGARDALDVLAMLDTPAWAVLLMLLDECPTLHAMASAARDGRTLSVNAADFAFISENSQIASVHEFVRSLPEAFCL